MIHGDVPAEIAKFKTETGGVTTFVGTFVVSKSMTSGGYDATTRPAW